jgi:hydroxyacylglutathione hydrolase
MRRFIMQVSEHVHALKIPFQIPLGPGKTLDRFAYCYLICGSRVTLVDAGVSSSSAAIFDYLGKTGRRPEDISLLVLTHSHPDHIGGAAGVVRSSGCKVAAHAGEIPWIEDTERQFRERPIPGFHTLVEGPVKVDHHLEGGEILEPGGDLPLQVIHTPGHSRGSISLYLPADGVLVSGDAVPLKGGLPIYEDVPASLESLKRLRSLQGLKVLLSAWDEPRSGEQIYKLMDEASAYIRHIDDVIRREKGDAESVNAVELGARVMRALGFPETALGPVAGTIKAHLKAITDH